MPVSSPFPRKVTSDGLETQLAVNWLAAFMLTGLLLPRLLQSTGAAGGQRELGVSLLPGRCTGRTRGSAAGTTG